MSCRHQEYGLTRPRAASAAVRFQKSSSSKRYTSPPDARSRSQSGDVTLGWIRTASFHEDACSR